MGNCAGVKPEHNIADFGMHGSTLESMTLDKLKLKRNETLHRKKGSEIAKQ